MTEKCKKNKAKIIYLDNCKHEVFMEKDEYRKIFWNEFDNFFKK